MSFEHLFATSSLNVVVPDTSVEYPPTTDADDWLKRLQSSHVERKQAFFGESQNFCRFFNYSHRFR